jgi:flagellar protein FliO/FliZ
VLEVMLRIGFSLLVIFAIMWLLAKVARKPLAGRAGGALTVLARQQLTRASSVAVVRVADRALIVGVTDTQVTLLGETEAAALARPNEEPVSVREPVELLPAVTPRPAIADRPTTAPSLAPGMLHGSVLSPRTWVQTVEFLRDRTVRR